MVRVQVAIFGDGEVEPSKENAVFICLEVCKCGLPKLLAMKLALLDFEARKDAAQARAHLHTQMMYLGFHLATALRLLPCKAALCTRHLIVHQQPCIELRACCAGVWSDIQDG